MGIEDRFPFIEVESGRRKDLDKIIEFCSSPTPNGNNILLIQGGGGVGKTRLIEESIKHLEESGDVILFPKAVDFDNPAFGFLDEIIRSITIFVDTQMPGVMDKYEQLRDLLSTQDSSKVDSKKSNEYYQKLLNAWHEAARKALGKKPFVVFVDTTDALKRQSDFRKRVERDFLIKFHKSIKFVIAGRDSIDKASKELLNLVSADSMMELEHLSKEECQKYIDQKCRTSFSGTLGLNNETHLVNSKRLIKLAHRNIILIDLYILTVQRRQDIILLDADISLDDFKKSLIKAYLSDDKVDRIVKILSYCYPMNLHMLEAFVFPGMSAEEVFKKLHGMTFVKILPDDYIRLHDVFRDMFKDYILESWNGCIPKV